MTSRFTSFCTFLLVVFPSTALFQEFGGICAGEDECGERCSKIQKMFTKENLLSLDNLKYETIAQKLSENKVEVSIEIGVGRGGLSQYLLRNLQSLKEHHGIDPFAGGLHRVPVKKTQAKSPANRPSRASTEWAMAVLNMLQEFGCRFRLHKGYSSQMISHFASNSIDCIIFDADHSYIGIVSDVVRYASTIKPGGLLVFDDYYNEDFHGVKKAVDELTQMNELQLISINAFGNVMLIKPTDRPFITKFSPVEIAKAKSYLLNPNGKNDAASTGKDGSNYVD